MRAVVDLAAVHVIPFPCPLVPDARSNFLGRQMESLVTEFEASERAGHGSAVLVAELSADSPSDRE